MLRPIGLLYRAVAPTLASQAMARLVFSLHLAGLTHWTIYRPVDQFLDELLHWTSYILLIASHGQTSFLHGRLSCPIDYTLCEKKSGNARLAVSSGRSIKSDKYNNN